MNRILRAIRLLHPTLSILVALGYTVNSAYAQSYIDGTGVPTFTTSQPVELGFVNVANGNLHMELPISSHPQRGALALSEKIVYDSRIWKVVTTGNGSTKQWQAVDVPNSQAGWRFQSAIDTGSTNNNSTPQNCTGGGTYTDYTGFTWTSPSGTEIGRAHV